MPDVRMPDGAVVRFPDTMSPDEIRTIIARKFPEAAPESAAAKSFREQASAMTQKFGKDSGDSFMRTLDSGVRGAADTMSFGLADEIAALGNATVDAMTGKPGNYDRRLFQERVQQKIRDRADPVASTVGRVAGAVAGGVGLAKSGATVMGRGLPAIPAAALEGGLYGGAYGFGSGEGGAGNRAWEAGKGAAVGAATGAAVQAVGGAIANKLAARRAAANVAPPPSVDDLAAQSKALYQAADEAGIVVKPDAFERVVRNAEISAGNINRDLRPNTAGVIDDLLAKRGQPVTLTELDELRQVVNQSMERAQPQDARTLARIKTVLDAFADNAKPGDIIGDVKGFELIKEARGLWARKVKTERVAALLDLAEVNASGKYTQSGMANSIRQTANTLYKDIVKNGSQGFSKEEIALIRKMASGGSNSQMVNWLAKWAPKGVIPTVGGASFGGMLGGPLGTAAGIAVPVAGAVAQRSADKGAAQAFRTLQDSAARGGMRALPALPQFQMPLIGPMAESMAVANRPRR